MKTVCIYHSIDLDGWMSAAVVKHYWNNMSEAKSADAIIDFIGYNYGQPVPDLSKYNKIIMCDISFPKEEMFKIEKKLNENFIWIDHHISAIKEIHNVGFTADGIRDVNYAACELTWKYFFPNETMPEIVRLLGRYDCFGHKGTDEEQKVLEFQYGARAVIDDYKKAYKWLTMCLDHLEIGDEIGKIGKGIYGYLITEAKQTYKNGFKIEFDNLNPNRKLNVKLKLKYKFIAINKERFNPINFRIEYHKDGYDGAACFHYDGKMWKWSLYNDNKEVDCSLIAKTFGGGGHKGAAGFVLNNEQQVKLINK